MLPPQISLHHVISFNARNNLSFFMSYRYYINMYVNHAWCTTSYTIGDMSSPTSELIATNLWNTIKISFILLLTFLTVLMYSANLFWYESIQHPILAVISMSCAVSCISKAGGVIYMLLPIIVILASNDCNVQFRCILRTMKPICKKLRIFSYCGRGRLNSERAESKIGQC